MTNIKVIEKKGKFPGKTVVILVGVHGNEVCGPKALDSLLPELQIENGIVFFIYSNLEAIRRNVRLVEANLNRCFLKEQPEEIVRSLEGKTAREIIPYLEKADFMLDVHASFTKDSKPFVICRESLIEEARIFDSDLVVCNFDPFEPGSTDYYMNLLNKPGFCFECGYLGDSKTQEIAEKAISSFLIYYGSINSNLEKPRMQKALKIKSLYKNIQGQFKMARYFPDFEQLKERTLIGRDGQKDVYCESGDIVLFVRDMDRIGEECFLVAEERIT